MVYYLKIRRFSMVKHIILWQLKDEFSPEKKAEIAAGIKAGLEGLQGVIPGQLSIRVKLRLFPNWHRKLNRNAPSSSGH